MRLTWQGYFTQWTRALTAAGFDPANLVADKYVIRRPDLPDDDARHDIPEPDDVIDRDCCDWWPADPDDELAEHTKLQAHFVDHPGTFGPYGTRGNDIKAYLDTACALRRAAGNPERACAILLNALRHTGFQDFDGRVPRKILFQIHDVIPADLRNWIPRYHHASPGGMPRPVDWIARVGGHPLDVPRPLDLSHARDLDGAAEALIRYQIDTLRCHRPVRVAYANVRVAAVWARIEARRQAAEAERQRRNAQAEALQARYREAMAARARQEAEWDAAHPRRHEWAGIDRAELTRCVWSKPTRELAQDFGVSDTAIAKRCKTLGVEKPPRGFWARVQAGKLPHPGGRPTRTGS